MWLIDGNKLKEKAVPLLVPTTMELCGHLPGTIQAVTVSEIEDMLYREGIEIVRCEDCKHCLHYPGGWSISGYVCDCRSEAIWKLDDFCSYGERKDGADAKDT